MATTLGHFCKKDPGPVCNTLVKQLDFGCIATLFMILVKETKIMNEVMLNHTIVKMERELKRRERCGHPKHLRFKKDAV